MMAEGSSSSPTSIPNRRSSIRRSGVSSSPPSSLCSQILPPRSRAMTAGELHNAMEQEQEHIANNLLKHIDQLRADKIRIEHELEAESEAVMNRLARELSTLRNRLEAAGLNAAVEPSNLGNQSPRSPSRSPSRASSLSRRSLSGANSPRLNPAHGSSSPAITPLVAPAPRRDSLEMRGRANSSLNGETHSQGLDKVLDSLQKENNDLKKSNKELDDRYRCKQAECDRLKQDIITLKMELSILQRRKSASQGSVSPNSVPTNSFPSNLSSIVPNTNTSSIVPSQSTLVPSTVATVGSVTSPVGKRDPQGNGLGITGLRGGQDKGGNGASVEVQIGSVDQRTSGPGTSAEGPSSSLEVQMGSIEGGQTTTSTSGRATTESIAPDPQGKK